MWCIRKNQAGRVQDTGGGGKEKGGRARIGKIRKKEGSLKVKKRPKNERRIKRTREEGKAIILVRVNQRQQINMSFGSL